MFKINKLLCETVTIPALRFVPNTFTLRYYTEKIGKQKSKERKKEYNKENHCMLIAYSGTNYYGMEHTYDNMTIERVLFDAMFKNKWITTTNYYKKDRINYQQASRTDKGVSAARQCLSMLLPTGDLDIQDLNKDLPNDVRVIGLKRVTHNFNSRTFCMYRTYSYTLPTIAFSHYNDQTSQRDYRISSDKLKFVNDLLQLYTGTKRFHNFTVGKLFSDYSCVRNMINLECSSPFLVNDVEFCVIRIRGRSFMMHQIRRMIGLLLAVTRDVIDSSIFNRAFTHNTINAPMAPGLGLVLDRQDYDEYNRLRESDGLFEKLTWEQCDDAIQQFREQYIDSTIYQTEIINQPMYEWLELLLNYPYIPDGEYDLVPRSSQMEQRDMMES